MIITTTTTTPTTATTTTTNKQHQHAAAVAAAAVFLLRRSRDTGKSAATQGEEATRGRERAPTQGEGAGELAGNSGHRRWTYWEKGAGRARRSWREGGVRSIATGGWVGEGGMGLEGKGTTGPSEKVNQQQQTKHCSRWREAPSAISGGGGSKTCGRGRARRSWREGGVRSIATGGWVGDGGMGLEGRGTRGNCPHLPEMRRSWKRTCVGSDGVWWRGRE